MQTRRVREDNLCPEVCVAKLGTQMGSSSHGLPRFQEAGVHLAKVALKNQHVDGGAGPGLW